MEYRWSPDGVQVDLWSPCGAHVESVGEGKVQHLWEAHLFYIHALKCVKKTTHTQNSKMHS